MSFTLSSIYELVDSKKLLLKEEKLDHDQIGDFGLIAETVYSAISPGTEVAAYAGLSPLRPGKIYPRVLGYCNVAFITHVGEKVSTVKVGDHILSFQSHRSAFKITESDFYILLDKNIDLQHATTAYLFHLGYHGLITADVRAGHNVGIIGLGTLGYTTCMMSKLAGANTFVFTGQNKDTRDFDLKGITCLKKSEESLQKVDVLTHGAGLDIIINTSNKWEDWLLALQAVNKGGTIVNTGFPGRGEPSPAFNPFDPQYVYIKNVTIKALSYLDESGLGPHEFRFNVERNLLFIIDNMKKGYLNASEIITGEIGFKELSAQYDTYLKRDTALYTTLINWKR